jgi:hypothetical protein
MKKIKGEEKILDARLFSFNNMRDKKWIKDIPNGPKNALYI